MRTSQPRGYKNISGNAGKPIIYYCKNHDYHYYPNAWVDDAGNINQSGFYDENGSYYSDIKIKKGDGTAVNHKQWVVCEYCRTSYSIDLNGSQQMITCPSCGAQSFTTEASMEDEMVSTQFGGGNAAYGNMNRSIPSSGGKNTGLIVGIVCVVVYIVFRVGVAMYSFNTARNTINDTWDYEYDYDNDDTRDFVLDYEITPDGNKAYWDNENMWYYDSVSDCYFCYNDDVEYPQWQYWFEGISSDYDGYGWMEYDFDEECWYIEKGYEDWVVYTGDTSNLWHFD